MKRGIAPALFSLIRPPCSWRGVDLASEAGIDAQGGAQFGEEAGFGGVVAVDGDAGGGVDLQGFCGRGDGGGEGGRRGGIAKLVLEEGLGFGAGGGATGGFDDAGVFAVVDAAVGGGRGDHGLDDEHGGVVGDRGGFEAGAGGGLGGGVLRAGDEGLAGLMVLVGLVGEAADEGERAELDGAGGDAAAGLGAEQDCTETAKHRAGAQLVVGDQVLHLRDHLVG